MQCVEQEHIIVIIILGQIWVEMLGHEAVSDGEMYLCLNLITTTSYFLKMKLSLIMMMCVYYY